MRNAMQWHGLHQINELLAALQFDTAILGHSASCCSIDEDIDLCGKLHKRFIKSTDPEEYVARQYTENWIGAGKL